MQAIRNEDNHVELQVKTSLANAKLYYPLFANFQKFCNQSHNVACAAVKKELLALKPQCEKIKNGVKVLNEYIEDIPYKIDKVYGHYFKNDKIVFEYSTMWCDVEVRYDTNLKCEVKTKLDPNMMTYITDFATGARTHF